MVRRAVVRHRGLDASRRTHAALVLIIGVAVTACSSVPMQATTGRVPAQPTSIQTPVDGCPAIAVNESGGAVLDYVDFLVFGRTTYLAGLQPVPEIAKTDLDEIIMTSRCSFRELNDRTRQKTPKPEDGHTAYLPPGTPVYAIRGWSPTCRLAAEHNGDLHVYVALEEGAPVARPAPCALASAPSSPVVSRLLPASSRTTGPS